MTADTLRDNHADDGPGSKPVSRNGILSSLAAVTMLSAILLYSLYAFLPNDRCAIEQPVAQGSAPSSPPPSADTPKSGADSAAKGMRPDGTQRVQECAPQAIHWLGRGRKLTFDQQLFIAVILAGMLGGALHLLRSISWYIGNRQLVWSWLAYYLMLPIIGGALAVVAYVVMRAGFLRIGTGTPYSYLAVALLVGMFSTPAALRLKEIAEAVFSRPRGGADTAPSQSANGTGVGGAPSAPLAITDVQQERRSTGASRDALIIKATGLSAGVTVVVNGVQRPSAYQAPDTVTLELDATDLARLDAGGDFRIALRGADGSTTPERDVL